MQISELLKKLGYKKTGKSFSEEDMWERKNTIIYISKITFKKTKSETFKQVSDRMFGLTK